MHSYTLITGLTVLAGYAIAEAHPNYNLPGYEAVPSPAPTTGPKLGRRQDMDCFASITDEVIGLESPSATELEDWLGSQTYDINQCTLTAPASLSSDLVSYASYISEFWAGAESRFDEIDTMCGADELVLELTQVGCSETPTALFTSGGETETVALASPIVPTESFTKSSAAVGQRGMMGLAGVASVAFAAILAL